MASHCERLWIMGCFERDILRLFVIRARTEIEANRKAGIILRKNRTLWFDSLQEGRTYFDLYSGKILNDERTTMTIYDPVYYTETTV